MICQINPKIKCSLPSARSCDPTLTTEHPIPFAEEMTILLFSVIWNALSGRALPVALFTEALFRTRSSIVSGTESLMSLQRTRPSEVSQLSPSPMVHIADLDIRRKAASCPLVSVGHVQHPHRPPEPNAKVSSFHIRTLYGSITPLMWSVKDRLSSSSTVCWVLVPAVPLTEILPLFDASLHLRQRPHTHQV